MSNKLLGYNKFKKAININWMIINFDNNELGVNQPFQHSLISQIHTHTDKQKFTAY